MNSQHLIDAVIAQNVSFPDFKRFFKTWEDQEGVPLVTAMYNPSSDSFVLTQQRFFDKSQFGTSDNSSWYIPINFATELNPDFENTQVTNFMKDGDVETVIPAPANFNNSQWYIINKQQNGYYRVNYDAANWNNLARFLHTDDFEKIHVVNRMHLIDNAFVFAHEGYIDYRMPYEIITYLVNEKNFFTWDLFNDNINRLYEVFGTRDALLNVSIFLHLKLNLKLIFISLYSALCITCRRTSTRNTNLMLSSSFLRKRCQFDMVESLHTLCLATQVMKIVWQILWD